MVDTVSLWQSVKSGIPGVITWLGIAGAATIFARYGLGWGQPTFEAGGVKLNLTWIVVLIVIAVLAYFMFFRKR
jgi:hypothetical protein